MNLWFTYFQSMVVSISFQNSIIPTLYEMSSKSSLCSDYISPVFENRFQKQTTVCTGPTHDCCLYLKKHTKRSNCKRFAKWSYHHICGTIASRHLVGRWSRDYHMCRLVFLCFFPRPRCFQIRGKRRWVRSSRWRLEFVLERRKSCQANFKKWRK